LLAWILPCEACGVKRIEHNRLWWGSRGVDSRFVAVRGVAKQPEAEDEPELKMAAMHEV
jgi:hypothetical protein